MTRGTMLEVKILGRLVAFWNHINRTNAATGAGWGSHWLGGIRWGNLGDRLSRLGFGRLSQPNSQAKAP